MQKIVFAVVGGVVGFLLGFAVPFGVFAKDLPNPPADPMLALVWLNEVPAELLRALQWTLAVSTLVGIVGCILGSILASNLGKRPRLQFTLWDMFAATFFVATIFSAVIFEEGICREVQKWWDSRFLTRVIRHDQCIAISPDGKLLATGTTPKDPSAAFEADVRLWELPALRERPIDFGPMRGAQSLVFKIPVAFSPDGKTLAAGAAGQGVILRDVTTGRERVTIPTKESAVFLLAFSPDGQILATLRYWWNRPSTPEEKRGRSELNLWNLRTKEGRVLAEGRWLVDFSCLAFSPDGKTLALGSERRPVRLWDVATGQMVAYSLGKPFCKTLIHPKYAELNRPYTTLDNFSAMLNRDLCQMRSLAFSPDGELLAVGETFGFSVWDMATGQQLARLDERTAGRWNCVAFSPNGKILATANANYLEELRGSVGGRAIKLWDVVRVEDRNAPAGTSLKLNPRCTLQEHAEQFVNCMVFAPDGKTLTTVGGHEAHVWDVATGEEIVTPDHTDKLRIVQIALTALFGVVFCWFYRSSSKRQRETG